MTVADSTATSILTPDADRGLAAGALQSLDTLSIKKAGTLIPRDVLADIIRCADFAVAMVTGLVVASLYLGTDAVQNALTYPVAVIAASAVLVAVFHQLNLYNASKFAALDYQFPRIVFGWLLTAAVLMGGVFFFKTGSDFSRVWLLVWFASGVAGTLLLRGVVGHLSRGWLKSGRLSRRAVVYGSGAAVEQAIRAIEADDDADVLICGVFDDRGEKRAGRYCAGHSVAGKLTDLLALARVSRIDVVIVALPMRAEERIADVVEKLSQLPVDIKLPADLSRVRFAPYAYSRLGSLAMIDVLDKPLSAWGGIVKTVFDKAIAALALILLAPVMLAVALAVKLDSRGPVFFRQKRYGLNNELIDVFKFRSMYVDMCDASASRLVTKGDPRVTPVGQFIRKTSIDELPQLFNVLLGDLSLVGPRPHAVAAKAGSDLYDQVVNCYYKRHKVKPGITGWAQINGWRGETDTHEKIVKRVEHDLYYIENWSVFLDLYILLKTPLALLKSENAY